jgi:YbgC/YbaW family acyl-CoA thioester hydrolase
MPEITIVRRLEWQDTDAAGIYHYTTAFRFAEAAEAALHTRLGIEGITFGATPRVSVSFEFARPIEFNDEVQIHLVVAALGRTSVTYEVELTHAGQRVASGRVVGVFIDRATQRPEPWPETVRAALSPSPPRAA